LINTNWHFLKNLKETDTFEISAEATLEPGSSWFDGHFPGTPILPGIAQISLAFDAIQEHSKRKGKPLALSGVSRVRFRQFIKPGDSVQVTAAPDREDPDLYKFRVTVGGQLACNGIMKTAPAHADRYTNLA
jgi:3-hydroxyacyl-[acyl-carrier-protein] dehydratase